MSIVKRRSKSPSAISSLLTIRQACTILNCHPNTLRSWDRKGILKAIHFGSRGDRRYKKEEIEKLLANTSSKKTNDSHHQNNSQNRMFFLEGILHSPDLNIVAIDTDYNLVECNDVFAKNVKKYYGIDIYTKSNMPEAIAHLSDDFILFDKLWKRALRGESFTYVHRFGDSKYGRRLFESNASPIKDAQQRIIGACVIAKDVTERVKYEKVLKKHDAIANKNLVSSLNGLYIFDIKDGQIVFINPQYTHLTGFTLKDLKDMKGDEFLKRFHPDDLPKINKHIKRMITAADGAIVEFEYRFLRKDNRWIWCNSRETVLSRNHDGTVHQYIGTFLDITERKQAENNLKKTEEKFRLLANSMPQLVWTAEANGNVDYYNKRANEFDGLNQKEDGTWEWQPVVHPEDEQKTIAAWDKAVKHGTVYQVEHRIKQKDGSYRWFLSRGIPAFDEQGKVIKWYGTATDINDYVRTTEKLREREEHFRATFQQAPLAVSIANLETGKYIDVNEAFLKLYQYKKEEVIGKTSAELRTWADYKKRSDFVSHLKKHGYYPPSEFKYRRKDGLVRDAILSASIIHIDHIEYIIAHLVDITDRKHLIEEIRKSRDQLNAILQTEADGIIVYDAQGKTLYVNERGANLTEFMSIKEFIKARKMLNIYSNIYKNNMILDENNEPMKMENLPSMRVFNGASYAEALVHNVHKTTKKDYWLLVRSKPFHNENGKLEMVVTVMSDVTRQKRAEEESTMYRQRLELAQAAGRVGIFNWNIKKNIITWSKEMEELYGMEPGTFDGKYESWVPLVAPEDLERVEKDLLEAYKTGKFMSEWRVLYPDSSIHWIHGRGKVLFDKQGRPEKMFGANIDITERKALEHQKDEFIGIASHELRTPITSIKAYEQVLQRLLSKKGEMRETELLQKMDIQINKLTILINDLLDVTKIEAGKLQLNKSTFSVDELVKEVVEAIQLTSERHTINISGKTDTMITADRDRIGQVLINFLSNAIKYSPQSGSISVTLSVHSEHVKICVRDYGVGIDKDQQDKVFDRFYRSYGQNHEAFPGLGLGLYISSEIIRRHKGNIWVESKPGKGSRFFFMLPIA